MSKGARALLAGIAICIFAGVSGNSVLFPWYVKLAIGVGFLGYGSYLMLKKE
jgi:hypothetical protein